MPLLAQLRNRSTDTPFFVQGSFFFDFPRNDLSAPNASLSVRQIGPWMFDFCRAALNDEMFTLLTLFSLPLLAVVPAAEKAKKFKVVAHKDAKYGSQQESSVDF